VLELARDTLHVEASEIARDIDHVVIDGSSHSAALMRSAMLAADLALVPAQPSPFDGWALSETLRLLQEARLFRPRLIARFVLNRCVARTLIASEITEVLARHDPPALAARVGQRVAFADAARTGTAAVDQIVIRRAILRGGHCLTRNVTGQVLANDWGGYTESGRCRRWREGSAWARGARWCRQ
jgi:chromosome partitioning protein